MKTVFCGSPAESRVNEFTTHLTGGDLLEKGTFKLKLASHIMACVFNIIVYIRRDCMYVSTTYL